MLIATLYMACFAIMAECIHRAPFMEESACGLLLAEQEADQT